MFVSVFSPTKHLQKLTDFKVISGKYMLCSKRKTDFREDSDMYVKLDFFFILLILTGGGLLGVNAF